MHLDDALFLPFVKYVGYVEAGVVEQECQIFHLDVQYLGALQVGA